jgi:small subunit ribosomal protein S20
MPILKNAIKKMRQDKKRTEVNKGKKTRIRTLIKSAKTEVSVESLSNAYSALDKAAKSHLIHKKKADRLKSRLALAIAKITASAGAVAPKVTKETATKKATTKKTAKKATKTA